MQYGEKTNDQLMLYYGFSEADNPVDTYTFTNLPDLLEAQGVNVEDSR